MNLREEYEKYEEIRLSKFACSSNNSRGRKVKEEECKVRTKFQRDRDRIIHSKSFRRLKHKTQVFLAPEGDHYRTRLTHTLEVSQISRTIARALRLNEDLTEAISLGHDLGHTPFGHNGEKILNNITSFGFQHNIQSLRVVDLLEKHKDMQGLNLTFEVRDGILNHRGEGIPITLEGRIVKTADRIAYLNHDIDDAVRAGVIENDEIPENVLRTLGKSHGERINNMVLDMIENSRNKDDIMMSSKAKNAMDELRNFMFENIYLDDEAKGENYKAEKILKDLFYYYMDNPLEIPQDSFNLKEDREIRVKDYIAGMTDRYAIKKFKDIFMPLPWDK